MKVQISVLGLVQVVLLLLSIAFLWLTIWSYLQIEPRDLVSVMAKPVQDSLTKMLGTAFLVSYGIFIALFFANLYQRRIQERSN